MIKLVIITLFAEVIDTMFTQWKVHWFVTRILAATTGTLEWNSEQL